MDIVNEEVRRSDEIEPGVSGCRGSESIEIIWTPGEKGWVSYLWLGGCRWRK